VTKEKGQGICPVTHEGCAPVIEMHNDIRWIKRIAVIVIVHFVTFLFYLLTQWVDSGLDLRTQQAAAQDVETRHGITQSE